MTNLCGLCVDETASVLGDNAAGVYRRMAP